MRKRLAAAFLAAPAPALAHGSIPGIEGVYTGLALPAAEPALGLAVLALTLSAVQIGPGRFPQLLGIFTGALLLTLLAVSLTGTRALTEIPLLAAALVTAAMVALLAGRWPTLGPAMAAATGVLAGATALPDPGPLAAVLPTTIGSALGPLLQLLIFYGALEALRERFDGPVFRIGLRVAAAWIGAISLLMLALLLGPGVGSVTPP